MNEQQAHLSLPIMRAYLGGNLPAERLLATAAHLTSCEQCRAWLLRDGRLDHVLACLDAPPAERVTVSARLPERVRQALQRDLRRRRLRVFVVALPLTLGLLVALRRAARGSRECLAAAIVIAVGMVAALYQLVRRPDRLRRRLGA